MLWVWNIITITVFYFNIFKNVIYSCARKKYIFSLQRHLVVSICWFEAHATFIIICYIFIVTY